MPPAVRTQAFTRCTLALDIVRKISGGLHTGYHEMRIIKHGIDLADILTVTESPAMKLTCSHPAVPCDESNLCWRTAAMLKKRYHISESVRIDIQKNIPVQGGLAGGSADAAATLACCCSLWNLSPTMEEHIACAREIGMDIPYYLYGGTVLDTEAGEHIHRIPTRLTFSLILVLPDFGIPTPQAYSSLDYSRVNRHAAKTTTMEQAFLNNNASGVCDTLHNDFEDNLFPLYPQLQTIRDTLLDAGCRGAVVSGSGSTVVGIAEDPDHARATAKRLPWRSVVTHTHTEQSCPEFIG